MFTQRIIDTASLLEVKQKVRRGLLPQWAFTSDEIYERELTHIFAKTWHFLGHESEIAKPGDYVTRWLVRDPALLLRDSDGHIRAYLNSCAHRGTRLCTSDLGNRNTFTCPYHGWTYNLNGDLVGIVAGNRVYGAELDRSEWSLRKLPRCESYRGMIFASLNPEAPPLEEFLGDMRWYFDIMVGRSDGGLEVRGVPHRWVVHTNWKVSADNFGGDPYHTAMTHRSTVELGISPKDPLFASYGHQVVLDNGHGINVITTKDGTPRAPYQGLQSILNSLHKEAKLLDSYRLDEWLDTLAESVVYRMPVRVTREKLEGGLLAGSMAFLDENKQSLRTRVERLKTTSA